MSLATVLVVSIAGCIAVAWAFLAYRRPVLAVTIIVGLAVASSHVLSLLFQAGVSAEVVRLLIVVKDVLSVTLTAALLVRALRDRHELPLDRRVVVALAGCGALLALVCLPAALRGLQSAPLNDVGLSLRGALLPFAAIVAGLLMRPDERRGAARGAVVLITAAAAYALVEYVLPVSFVRDVVGVGDYWVKVKEQAYHLDPKGSGLPGNFFTGGGTRRLSGSFGDPLAAGYALAAALVLAVLARPRRWQWLAVGVLAVALLATLTRGGWIIAAGALLPYAATRAVRNGPRARAALVGLVAAGVLAVLCLPRSRHYLVAILTGQDDSTVGHLKALARSTGNSYSVFGGGFGAAGGPVGKGTESVFVTLALELGVVGLIGYLAALAVLAWLVGSRWARAGEVWSFAGAAAGLVVSMLVSEQLLTFNAGWVVTLALALLPWSSDPGSPAAPEAQVADQTATAPEVPVQQQISSRLPSR